MARTSSRRSSRGKAQRQRPTIVAALRAELERCSTELRTIRRDVTALRTEIDHLREKIRS